MKQEQEHSIANYVHTGGFNRLRGRPMAPGSWRPEHSFARWRTFLIVCGLIFLGAGMFYVIF